MRILLLLLALAGPAAADYLVPKHTLRAKTLLTEADFLLHAGYVPGALTRLEDVVGMEADLTLYEGRPVRARDVTQPALVDRNQIVTLRYASGLLEITTDGRALARASEGELIRVQNLTSHATVTARVLADGSLLVR